MPRPGCVWTHVLLIAAVDLARIVDLSVLDVLLRRPGEPGDYGEYVRMISFDLATSGSRPTRLDISTGTYLAKLIYGGIQAARPADGIALDRGLLAIWSQQWPGLRRQFSFRTALLSSKKTSSACDFAVEFSKVQELSSADINGSKEAAFKLIAKDLSKASPGAFRRFLWRYGADTENRPQDLLHLAQLYLALYCGASTKVDVSSIIACLSKWYPRPSDAYLLKADISGITGAEFSLVPNLDTFEVIKALIAPQVQESLPMPEAIDSKTIKLWLRTKPTEFTELLAACADNESSFAESLFSGIAHLGNPAFIWNLYGKSEKAFLRVSKRNLDHLADLRIGQLDDETLLMLLTSVAPGHPNFEEIVPYLLHRRNTNLISLIATRAGEVVTKRVIWMLAHGGDLMPDSNWVDSVKKHPDQIKAFAKTIADRRSQLLVCRQLLNADYNATALTVWSERLCKIPNDLSGEIDLEFRVFLLTQVFKRPEKGADLLLADALDPVYEALEKGTLPFLVRMRLADYLPRIGWMANSDKCQRLKIAVIATCKHLEMSKKATLALTENKRLRDGLGILWS